MIQCLLRSVLLLLSHLLQQRHTLNKYHNLKQSVRAIAHAVSRRLPTAAARVRAWVRSCGICGG
jgi:hypothetical protein